jgi:predicted Holliday junction resolvase-like endonuclease
MPGSIGEVFGSLSQLIGVCPCCGEVFYLYEAHPYHEGQKPHSPPDRLRAEERRLEQTEQRLDELEWKFRDRAARAGLRATKRVLRKIDPVFSGAGYDPQDVKVAFNPVTYVVFNGLAKGNVTEIRLLANPSQSRVAEQAQSSIERTVIGGNFEFRTLHVDGRGIIATRT